MSDASPAPAPAAAPLRWARWFWPALAATLVLDLASKQLLFGHYPVGAQPHPLIWLAINKGVAFSLFARTPSAVLWMTLALIPVLAWIWWSQYRRCGRTANLAFGLILGGALGNCADRLAAAAGRLGGVRDFIHVDLGFWPLDPWPTFNIADAGITVGFAVLLVGAFLPARKAPAAANPS
jgi:signal peptidase II